MRILIPSVQTPFIKGGAYYLTIGLKNALEARRYEVEIVTLPFKFFPESYIYNIMDTWKELDLNNFNGYVTISTSYLLASKAFFKPIVR